MTSTLRPRVRLLLALGVGLGTTGLAACSTEARPAGAAPTASRPVPSPLTLRPSPPPPTCTPDGVSVSMDEPDAAMGLRAATITLRNCGGRPYRLNGYPSLRVLDENRQPFNVDVVRGTTQIKDGGPKPLTIRPGEAAVFGIVWRNLVTEATTEAVTGRYLEVRPAPGRPVVVIPSNGPLDLGNTGRLEETAWRPPRR
ncbi:DUF4232 domain-containing protein [Spirillospora sp. CA-128828]|uniref:DUF4232 domain-containing protein n=1 Tax=Spirillospora sp. CA-128828 TaxID=3240033 RepID=UPI003D900BFD